MEGCEDLTWDTDDDFIGVDVGFIGTDEDLTGVNAVDFGDGEEEILENEVGDFFFCGNFGGFCDVTFEDFSSDLDLFNVSFTIFSIILVSSWLKTPSLFSFTLLSCKNE